MTLLRSKPRRLGRSFVGLKMKRRRSGMRGRPGLFMGKRRRIRMRIEYRIWDIGRKIKIKIKMKMKEATDWRDCRLSL